MKKSIKLKFLNNGFILYYMLKIATINQRELRSLSHYIKQTCA